MNDKFRDGAVDLDHKCIMVTGGTGSFGWRFVRSVLQRYKTQRVVIFSRDEHKQYDFTQELGEDAQRVRMFIGDVRDRDRLVMAMRGVDYVIHAAALKHVPTAEYNPFECIHTNVIGAENIVHAAIQNNVARVIGLSTDKAANPVNLYGASKLASDKILVAGNNISGKGGPMFSVVRYGNVIGSRGSVVPFFLKLVENNAPSIPITDPRMTRFWITIQQGVDFVLSCLARMRGGEIFVPKIPSMRITDLAECLAPGVPHEMVGIRPGEKVHEVMITEDDSRTTWELEDRYVIEPAFVFWEKHRRHMENAKQMPENFRFSSDSNHDWLDPTQLKALLTSQSA